MFSSRFWRGMLAGALVGMTIGAMISRRMEMGSSAMEGMTRTARRTMEATGPRGNRVIRMGKHAIDRTVNAMRS